MFGLPDLLAVKNVCQIPGYQVSEDGRVQLTLDAVAVSMLLEAGSGRVGSIGESGTWADEAARELALYLGGDDPWWEACANIADAGLRLDAIAELALEGPVEFNLL